MARRMHRGDFNGGLLRKKLIRPDFAEPVPDQSRRRMKKRKPLSISDKISIVYQVLIAHEK